MAEIERVIHKRYLLQRVLTQGKVCTVYHGFDQVLQRAVAVKVVPAAYIQEYRTAMRLTAQFSHPNIIGTYDLIQEPETLYVVQEFVDGDNFGTLLQSQLAPYAVADFGLQICQALLYAGSSTRKVCHGDLTPAAIVRDRRGLVRVGDFALPSDQYYFTSWSSIGGHGSAISDQDLPWGQQSSGRRADDTRAVGILLYQLLSGRPQGASSVEPPADGRLRFLRNVPVELCEIIARTVVRQHPQHINTVESLYEELKVQVDALEPPLEAAPSGTYQTEGIAFPQQFTPTGNLGAPGSGKLVTALPIRETRQAGLGLSSFCSEPNAQMMAMEQQAPPPVASSVADMPVKLATARPSAYSEPELRPRRLSLPALVFLCLLVFAAFFIVGYFVARAAFP